MVHFIIKVDELLLLNIGKTYYRTHLRDCLFPNKYNYWMNGNGIFIYSYNGVVVDMNTEILFFSL